MKRNRYMISWAKSGSRGREVWVMERKGNINGADIRKHEEFLGKKWGFSEPVIITNIVKLN